jgi:hypothetical protein
MTVHNHATLLLISVALVFSQATWTPNAAISFQIHSYDDARSWDALLVRGARWWKFDTHFVPSYDCHLFPSHSQCGAYGMLLLAHDDPKSHNVSYSDSNDLLKWLSSTSPTLLQGSTMALCGKGAPANVSSCLSNPHWKEYFITYDAFIGQLMSLQRNGLQVEFLLDGDLYTMGDCYSNRWLPWNKTWTLVPILGYETNLGEFGRYQVFNVPVLPPLITFR